VMLGCRSRSVWAQEVTYGSNGWHSHRHGLLFPTNDFYTADEIQDILTEILLRKLPLVGLEGSREDARKYGIRVSDAGAEIAEYIAKFGHEPRWDAASELTLATFKRGKKAASKTPWALLDSAQGGSMEDAERYKEYLAVYGGKRQLVWSRGLRADLGLGEEVGDEEAAHEEEEGEVVCTIEPQDWNLICWFNLRGQVLVAAENEGATGVQRVIEYAHQLFDIRGYGPRKEGEACI